ncbi:hypothetical protein N9594_00785 [bacterium]|nr:hypothetical protein [bacterium]
MREVVLFEFPSDYSKDKYVLFSIANFQNQEHLFSLYGKDLEISYLRPIEENIRIGKLTSDYALSLIPEFAENLNHQYGTSFSHEFWKTIIYPWLVTVTQIFYERQEMVNHFVESYKNEPLILRLAGSQNLPRVFDTAHLQSYLSFSPVFNYWCFSRIIERIAPKNWKIVYQEVATNWLPTEEKISKLKTLKETIRSVLRAIAPRCSFVYGLKTWERIYLSVILSFKNKISHCGLEINLPKVTKIEPEWVFDFHYILSVLAPMEFKNLRLPKFKESKKGKIRIYSNDLYYNLRAKIKAAGQKEQGEVIIPTQHGGYLIGSGYVNEVITNIELKQNYFISWGWKTPELKYIIPLPSPLLSRYKNRHNERNSDLVLMTTSVRFYSQRYNSGLQPFYAFDYRQQRVGFIQKLNKNVFSRLKYRPYREVPNCLRDRSHIENHFPNLRYLEGKNIHEKLLKCRLLVMDNPSTTVALAMAANIPLIIFFDPKFFPFVGGMKAQIKEFERVGIYHKNFESAAEFINNNYNDIAKWWHSDDVQEVRTKFSKTYAYGNKDWRKIWRNALSKL